jgi:hypothetical protein
MAIVLDGGEKGCEENTQNDGEDFKEDFSSQ